MFAHTHAVTDTSEQCVFLPDNFSPSHTHTHTDLIHPSLYLVVPPALVPGGLLPTANTFPSAHAHGEWPWQMIERL